jgi:hypothetical protein
MGQFADAIGLSPKWPVGNVDEINVLLTWAEAYLAAAEHLHSASDGARPTPFYCGPVMQIAGLATELTLKSMLTGQGKSKQVLRNYGHNTYKCYLAARASFDETKFINLHIGNCSHLATPEEVRLRLASSGENDIDAVWRVYFCHLGVLDEVYDKPYRSRYITAGPIVVPDTEVVLIGTKILLSAMGEKLGRL